MAKISKNKPQEVESKEVFYFGRKNFRLMLIGLAFIVIGFILMAGADANTHHGKFDPNFWNEDIFSFRRIRLAPLLIIFGFVIQVFAILKKK